MPRPSQNIDQALLDAGMALYPQHGCKGLAVRQVAQHAGVNLGMFHYHFKAKDIFIRAVLQRMYDAMFAELVVQGAKAASPLTNLRAVLVLLAHFARSNGAVLSRLLADAMGGEPVALEFLQASIPRHAGVVAGLIRQAQRSGEVMKAPVPRLLAFVAGAVGAPVVMGGAAAQVLGTRGDGALLQMTVQRHVLSDAAIAQRVDMVIRGISLAR